MTQIPGLLGVPGGGHNFFERVYLLIGQLGQVQILVLGDRRVRDRAVAGRGEMAAGPAGCAFRRGARNRLRDAAWAAGERRADHGEIPSGLPSLAMPELRIRDVEGIFPLAAGILLLAYVEGVSAGRTFAAKHGYALDMRQEFLGIGAANLATALGHGYPVAGGLSQSAVNDKAGARTPLALIFASITLAICLLYLTSLLENLPKAVLSAVVLTAILGLFDFRALAHMWRVSRIDFYAATIALFAVLLLGIIDGILLAAIASIVLLSGAGLAPARGISRPHPGTQSYSDLQRHPENETFATPS